MTSRRAFRFSVIVPPVRGMEQAESGLESTFVIQLAAPMFRRRSRAFSRTVPPALCVYWCGPRKPAEQLVLLGSSGRSLCVSEDKERMETAGGPELHRPALVPALHCLLCWHGEHHLVDPSQLLTVCWICGSDPGSVDHDASELSQPPS